ncbi:MAG: MBL fold metallo-hydrolase [Bacillota bacterium]
MSAVVTKLSITVLCENTASGRLLGEHGLALWVEAGDFSLLFDTGGGRTLAANASELQVDLARASAIVISHGHYDHCGGLAQALEGTGPVDVYMAPEAFAGKYGPHCQGQAPRYIGPPKMAGEYQELGARFLPGPAVLAPGVYLTKATPRSGFEDDRGGFRVRLGQDLVPDLFRDEQVLVVHTPGGTVVISGCAHTGIINSVLQAMEVTGNQRLLGVFGGTHLVEASTGRTSATVEALSRLNPGYLGTCHCTGFFASARLYAAFSGRFLPLAAGHSWQYPPREDA